MGAAFDAVCKAIDGVAYSDVIALKAAYLDWRAPARK
jgi:hypothetical protein